MTTSPTTSPPPLGGPAEIARLQELAVRAQAGDVAVLPELRNLLQQFPSVWRSAGDLAVRCEEVYLRLLSEDLFTLECVRSSLAELKAELAPKTPLRQRGKLRPRVPISHATASHATFHSLRGIYAPRIFTGSMSSRTRPDNPTNPAAINLSQ